MKKLIFGMVFFAAGFIFTSSVNAQTSHPRSINKREHRQQERIVSGVKNGSLTRREAIRLEKEQAQIRIKEARFRRSGDGLSPSERLRLQRELNQSSRHIYKQKHDDQNRPLP
jgi:hypothetical protein